jgi:hypothetical protein
MGHHLIHREPDKDDNRDGGDGDGQNANPSVPRCEPTISIEKNENGARTNNNTSSGSTATTEDLLAKVEQETERLLRMELSSSVMRSDPIIMDGELGGDSIEKRLLSNNNDCGSSDIAAIDVSAIDQNDGEDDDEEEQKPNGTSRMVTIPSPSTTADALEQSTTISGGNNHAPPPIPAEAPPAHHYRWNRFPRRCSIDPSRRRRPKLLLRVGGTVLVLVLTLMIMVLVPVLVVRSIRRRRSAQPATTTAGPDPTALCTQRPCAFTTTAELYKAVDWYFAHFLNHNNNNAPMKAEESPWAVQYGYPMNAWNVSLLTDFSNVFRVGAQRNSDPVAATNDAAKVMMADRRVFFDDAVFDISNWDVSRAQRMDFMVRFVTIIPFATTT